MHLVTEGSGFDSWQVGEIVLVLVISIPCGEHSVFLPSFTIWSFSQGGASHIEGMKLTIYLYLITGNFVHSHPPCVDVSGHLQSPSFYQGGKTPLTIEYKGGWAPEPV
jgi:hypothetical protein